MDRIVSPLLALIASFTASAADIVARPQWQRDHTLASGMREGVVWMFQEVARRTGKSRMREWLERLGYGNGDMRGGIDLFWLQGALRVSAMEQVDFLRRLAEGELPMSQRS